VPKWRQQTKKKKNIVVLEGRAERNDRKGEQTKTLTNQWGWRQTKVALCPRGANGKVKTGPPQEVLKKVQGGKKKVSRGVCGGGTPTQGEPKKGNGRRGLGVGKTKRNEKKFPHLQKKDVHTEGG